MMFGEQHVIWLHESKAALSMVQFKYHNQFTMR
jgi:hypothetical protein